MPILPIPPERDEQQDFHSDEETLRILRAFFELLDEWDKHESDGAIDISQRESRIPRSRGHKKRGEP